MSTWLDYCIVDVFTGRAFAGNPLAVVFGASQLTTAQLQALAVEFNLSETAFPGPSTDGDYALRIFTPGAELPFAGHPSVGSAWLLAQRGVIATGDRLQECGAGILPITVTAEGATLTGAAPSCSGPVEASLFLDALGLSADDLDGVARRASTGMEFTIVPVRAGALDRCVATTALPGETLVVEVALPHVEARMFAPGLGVAEDPATGSAALALGVWLHASGLVKEGVTDYVVSQGVAMGRPSLLRCAVTVEGGAVTRTTVSGSVVLVAEGRIAVPPPDVAGVAVHERPMPWSAQGGWGCP